jgi:tRNA (cmo5U34)-methyltransferase
MSEPAAAAAFSAHAPDYTGLRRRLVPDIDEFYGAVVDVLGLLDPGPARVLDLGAGTGLLSGLVADAFPGSTIELLDASQPMLREARQRLGAAAGAVHVADMAGLLPEGPFDAVVSALAIHHLDDHDKRELFARLREVLRRGGVFVNADQVAAPSPALTDVYEQMWVRECRALGASEAELDGARERMRHDRCVDVETQVQWLREAGFAPVDCVYKSWRFAVMAGFKEDGQ